MSNPLYSKEDNLSTLDDIGERMADFTAARNAIKQHIADVNESIERMKSKGDYADADRILDKKKVIVDLHNQLYQLSKDRQRAEPAQNISSPQGAQNVDAGRAKNMLMRASPYGM